MSYGQIDVTMVKEEVNFQFLTHLYRSLTCTLHCNVFVSAQISNNNPIYRIS